MKRERTEKEIEQDIIDFVKDSYEKHKSIDSVRKCLNKAGFDEAHIQKIMRNCRLHILKIDLLSKAESAGSSIIETLKNLHNKEELIKKVSSREECERYDDIKESEHKIEKKIYEFVSHHLRSGKSLHEIRTLLKNVGFEDKHIKLHCSRFELAHSLQKIDSIAERLGQVTIKFGKEIKLKVAEDKNIETEERKINKKLREYIAHHSEKGKTHEQLKEHLQNAGFDKKSAQCAVRSHNRRQTIEKFAAIGMITVIIALISMFMINPSFTGLFYAEDANSVPELITDRLIVYKNSTTIFELNEIFRDNDSDKLFYKIEKAPGYDPEKLGIEARILNNRLEVNANAEFERDVKLKIDVTDLKDTASFEILLRPSGSTGAPPESVPLKDLKFSVKDKYDRDIGKLKTTEKENGKFDLVIEGSEPVNLVDAAKEKQKEDKTTIEMRSAYSLNPELKIKISDGIDNRERSQTVMISDIYFENASIRVNRYGDVHIIMQCTSYDMDLFVCYEWSPSNLEFTQTENAVEFNITESGVYGGFSKEIVVSNLTENARIFRSDGSDKKADIYDINGKVEVYFDNLPVKSIVFKNINTTKQFSLGIEEVPLQEIPGQESVISYAIDPTELEFDSANVTFISEGTDLYKCKDWNFGLQTCTGDWTLFLSGLIPGNEYSFILTPDDPGFTSTVTNCAFESVAAKDSFGSACSNGTSLGVDDGNTEIPSYSIGGWGGVRIQSVNTSETNCNSIDSVSICYEQWYSSNAPEVCEIAVDADNGASYSNASITCPGGVSNPGVTCTNVTTNETWVCGNFFGTSGTRAYAKIEGSRLNPPASGNLNIDVLFFNVSYTLKVPPNVTALLPAAGNTYNISTAIEVSANVTDANYGIDNVSVNLTYPNGSSTIIYLFNNTANKFNASVIVSNVTGQHNITFIANNTNGGTNNSEKTSFIADDPAFSETITTCDAEDVAAKGSFASACDATDGSNIEIDDGNTESMDANSGAYAGIRIQSVNTSVTNCNSVGSVEICYEWWAGNDPTDCDISVDANGGSSYTAVSTTCPTNASENPGRSCINVTSNETWTCGNFFGSSGTRAVAKSEIARLSCCGRQTSYWDVFFFRVFYTTANNPLVQNLTPSNGTTFNVSSAIEIAADVAVTGATVGNVTANITKVDTFQSQIILLNNTVGSNKYNNTFTIPLTTGRYNISFWANSSQGVINSTETTNITVIDPAWSENVSACNKENNDAPKGAFTQNCGPTGPDDLSKNDNITTSTGYGVDFYAGFRIQSVNTSITDCGSISSAEICFERWSFDNNTADCDVSVDADNGASYTAITTSCPNSTANPGLVCTNVTTNETWICGNFFGSSGTRALAKMENDGTGSGNLIAEALYFRVAYAASVVTPANISLSQNSTNDPVKAGLRFNYTINLTNTGSGDAQLVNVTDNLPSGVTYINSTPTPASINNQEINWTVNVSSGKQYLINVTVDVNLAVAHGSALTNIINATFYNLSQTITRGSSGTINAVCGYVNSDITLSTNVATPGGGNCFIVNKSNVAVAGAGYNLTSDDTGSGIINPGNFNNITIKNFGNISRFQHLINFTTSVNSLITNNTMGVVSSPGTGRGIAFDNVNTTNITSNIIATPSSPVSVGAMLINLTNSNQNIISANTLNSSSSGEIIYLNLSANNNITSNNISNIGSAGDLVLDTSNRNNVTSNRFTASSGYAFRITGSNSSLASSNIITTTGNAHGIRLEGDSQNNTMKTNTISTSAGSAHGISISGSDNNIINETNSIAVNSGSTYGVLLISGANNNKIDSNLINTSGASSYSVFINASNATTVSSNTLRTGVTGGLNSYSVYVVDAKNNIITSNTILTSTENSYGIFVTGSAATNNTLTLNSINTTGVSGMGIYLNSTGSSQVHRNTIYTTGNSAGGLNLSNSDGNNISTNIINVTNTNARAVELTGSDNNIFESDSLNSTASYEISVGNSNNNTFRNIFMQQKSNFTTANIVNVTIKFNNTPVADSAGLRNLSDHYSISVRYTLDLGSRLNFTLNYTDTELTNLDETSIGIFNYNQTSSKYEIISSSSVNTVTNTINSGLLTEFNLSSMNSNFGSYGNETPILAIQKTDSIDPAIAGKTLEYNITLNNTGGGVNLVNISDILPGKFIYSSSQPTPASVNGQEINWTINISMESAYVINITGTINYTTANATVINNTVNTTYYNTTSNVLVSISQNTTINNSNPLVFNVAPVANYTYNTSGIIQIAANITDSDSTIHTTYANITAPNGTVQTLTLVASGGDHNYAANFALGAVYGRYNVTFFANDSGNNINDTETTYFNRKSLPTTTLIYPVAGNVSVFERFVNLNYSATDDDGDPIINYDINLTSTGAGNYFFENVTSSNYTTPELAVDTVYTWTARAYDGSGEGSFASVFTFTIASVVRINLNTNETAFGSMFNGQQNDTTDNSPGPMIIENTGNVLTDVSIYASDALWDTIALNTTYFQFKVDNGTEPASYNTSASLTSFANFMSGFANRTLTLKHFNYSDTNDSAEIDIKIVVPDAEPSGAKSAIINTISEAS